jgi:hypothetical protein
LASSIICFISSALGAAPVAVVGAIVGVAGGRGGIEGATDDPGLGAVIVGGVVLIGLGPLSVSDGVGVGSGGGVFGDIGLGAVITGDVVWTGLGAVGFFGVGEDFWATAMEAIASRVVSARIVGLMVWRLW